MQPTRLLDHIQRCNTDYDASRYRPFIIAGRQVGSVRDDFAELLKHFPNALKVEDDGVRLARHLTTPDLRSAALRDVVKGLVERKALAKFRAEDYPVIGAWGEEPLCRLDRSAVAVFGVKAFGVHINGFTRRSGKFLLWIGKRALDKAVEPGKLDNMVAGGQPAGLTLTENLIKEAHEEATIPQAMVLRAIPAGAITYCMEGKRGLKPDTMFVYDLELPKDFTPRTNDGEITDFIPMEPDAVIERMRTTYDFKFNVSLVLTDFLIRFGYIRPENEPDYLALVTGLHRPL